TIDAMGFADEVEAHYVAARKRQNRRLTVQRRTRIEDDLSAAHRKLVVVLAGETMEEFEVGFLLLRDPEVGGFQRLRRTDDAHPVAPRHRSRDLRQRLPLVAEAVARAQRGRDPRG